MEKQKAKAPSDSSVESRYLVMPQHANQYGTIFGGIIVAWVDMVASMAAQKHCGKEVVTVAIDSLSFREPVYIGEQVVVKAAVNYVGRTSMEVGVEVIRVEPASGKESLATIAFLTFVALDKNKKPTIVAAIVPGTSEEKKRYNEAQVRVQARKKLLKEQK